MPLNSGVTSRMEVRPLIKADASAFQVLRLSALRECPAAFGSSYEEECGIPVAAVSMRISETAERCVFGAFDQAELIGCIGLQRESKCKLAHKAFIWGMYVSPPYHNRGIGRQLLTQALQRAGAMPGLRQINLSVTAANSAALTLYENMGFRPFGTELNSLLISGELYNEVHMARSIRGES